MERANLVFRRMVVGGCLLLLSGVALAYDLSEIGLNGTLDTTLTVGASWSTKNADDRFIGTLNGGDTAAANFDDGRLNYGPGLISAQIKINSELALQFDNYGLFVRGYAFKDFVNDDTDRTPLNRAAKDQINQRVELLDAFVYGRWYPFDRLVTLRVGQQVLNWGEATFSLNGLSVVNPIDATRARAAGSAIKERIIPVPLVRVTANLTRSLTLSAFYQLQFEPFNLDPSGSFFSNTDPGGPNGQLLCLPQTRNDTDPNDPGNACLTRTSGKSAKDYNQYGIRLGWYAKNLNYTDFQFYYARYYSRQPILSFNAGEVPNVLGDGIDNPAVANATYQFDWARDPQELFGFSFNTPVGASTLQGEVAFHHNLAALLDPSVGLARAARITLPGSPPTTVPIPGTGVPPAAVGKNVSLESRINYTQVVLGVTHLFTPASWLGADNLALMAEIGLGHVSDAPDQPLLRKDANGDPNDADNTGWGIKVLFSPTYTNVFGLFTVSPRIFLGQDFGGALPQSVGTYVEGRRMLGIGVSVDYQAVWQFALQYTNTSAAKNPGMIFGSDRDFVNASISHSF